ncbi:hypothetical protein [Paraglaciecola chathamensis]|uniref:Uncharacterized protein n=1 Tax=Paraglaciecola chathamensis TaxID=368405 RepID=A0A8H9I9P3_9ALTE|nr:hypothetical protein [Paraglaciecola oceanifecundans]GGZ63431.1 hypothetical protein GCM10011274_21960 [Paraglaciecola oceanifecundans]
MEEIEVTWWRSARIWWSWAWRALLWTIPTAVLLGFAIGFTLAALGLSVEPFTPYIQTTGAGIGIFFGILAMKKIMGKQFNGFRIVVVKTADNENSQIEV